ncbi:MAG TPA: DUF5655 domain-containing protein [Cytophagaceae bacterium]|nr:DUF5655 domain-containing protein [Cytophagaceae bacterium]
MAKSPENPELAAFLSGKTEQTLQLLEHFVKEYKKLGNITIHPAKTMIGISNGHKRVAWITQLGENFVHVVFPFQKPYNENLCFQKIAQVPGDANQFNHHFRMLHKEDVNEEVLGFMKLAYAEEAK